MWLTCVHRRGKPERAVKQAVMSYIPFPGLSPDIFSVELFGVTIALRWYAMAYIVGILIGWRIVLLALRNDRLWQGRAAPMTAEAVERMVTWIILGVILGGRIGYVLFYQPGRFLANPADIVKVWQGGLSFHGGLLGVVVAALIFAGREGISRLSLGDLLAVAAPPGLFLGRLANFINAELWGRPTDVPWGVAFPGEAAQACATAAGLCVRHPSQIYQALTEGLILGLVLFWVVWRRGWLNWPGSVMGLFIAGYGAARFVVELFRQPDADFVSPGNPLGYAVQAGGWGLTMGQVLCLPMIALGLWFLLRARPSGQARGA
jgi:phosphatidylglycerol---prolipoprotein diacylglyceryl transferase